jgi:hypothetical protein
VHNGHVFLLGGAAVLLSKRFAQRHELATIEGKSFLLHSWGADSLVTDFCFGPIHGGMTMSHSR